MRRKNNFNDVRSLSNMLTEMKKLTLEHYILPDEEEDSFEQEEMPQMREEMPQQEQISQVYILPVLWFENGNGVCA